MSVKGTDVKQLCNMKKKILLTVLFSISYFVMFAATDRGIRFTEAYKNQYGNWVVRISNSTDTRKCADYRYWSYNSGWVHVTYYLAGGTSYEYPAGDGTVEIVW